jgi:hypothetical protein
MNEPDDRLSINLPLWLPIMPLLRWIVLRDPTRINDPLLRYARLDIEHAMLDPGRRQALPSVQNALDQIRQALIDGVLVPYMRNALGQLVPTDPVGLELNDRTSRDVVVMRTGVPIASDDRVLRAVQVDVSFHRDQWLALWPALPAGPAEATSGDADALARESTGVQSVKIPPAVLETDPAEEEPTHRHSRLSQPAEAPAASGTDEHVVDPPPPSAPVDLSSIEPDPSLPTPVMRTVALTVNGARRQFDLVDLTTSVPQLPRFTEERRDQEGYHTAKNDEVDAVIRLIAASERDGRTNHPRIQQWGRHLLQTLFEADTTTIFIEDRFKEQHLTLHRPQGNPRLLS